MKKIEVVDYFGGQKETGDALGISQAAVSLWGDEVPLTRQYQIEVITKGELKADVSISGKAESLAIGA